MRVLVLLGQPFSDDSFSSAGVGRVSFAKGRGHLQMEGRTACLRASHLGGDLWHAAVRGADLAALVSGTWAARGWAVGLVSRGGELGQRPGCEVEDWWGG